MAGCFTAGWVAAARCRAASWAVPRGVWETCGVLEACGDAAHGPSSVTRTASGVVWAELGIRVPGSAAAAEPWATAWRRHSLGESPRSAATR